MKFRTTTNVQYSVQRGLEFWLDEGTRLGSSLQQDHHPYQIVSSESRYRPDPAV